MRKLSVITLMTVLFCSQAYARVFDLRSRSFGTYFGGSVGSSNLSKQPWGDSSGSTTATDQSVKLNYSGEFGVLAASQKVNFRAGVEVLQPQHLSDIKGTDPARDLLFTLDSNTRAIIPKATFEFVVWKTNASAFMFGGSVGYAMVSMTNQYQIASPAGSAAFPGVSDYVEKASGNAIQSEGFVGYEFSFSDNVTIFTNLGYRYLMVSELTHDNANTAINGAVVKGSKVLKQSGENRTLNMSSAQAAIQFRFYF